MATADDYAAWIVKNADKKGTPDFETVAKAYRAAKSEGGTAPAAVAPAVDAPVMGPLSAISTGFNRGMVRLAGLPVDTMANIRDLGKAAIGAPYQAITGKTPPEWLQVGDRAADIGSGENMLRAMSRNGVTNSMVNGLADPSYEGGYLQAAGGAAAGAFTPNQLAMSVLSGVAGKATYDATGSNALAIAASLGPQGARQGFTEGTKRFVRGGEEGRQNMVQRVAALKAAGIDEPTLGLASGNEAIGGLENLLQNTPGAVGVMRRNRDAALAGAEGATNRAADLASTNRGATESGRSVQAGAKGFREDFKAQQEALYSKLDQFIDPQAPVSVANTRGTLADLNADIKGAPQLSKQFKNARIGSIEAAILQDSGVNPTGAPRVINEAVTGRPDPAGVDMMGRLVYRGEQVGVSNQPGATISRPSATRPDLMGRPVPVGALSQVSIPGQQIPIYASVPMRADGLGGSTPVAQVLGQRTTVIQPSSTGAFSGIGVAPQAHNTLPFEAVKKTRTLVGNEIADNSMMSDVPRSKWNPLYGALSEDMQGAATAAGPQAESALNRANQYTRAGLERMDKVAPIVDRPSPEQTFTALSNSLKENVSTFQAVKKILPEDARGSFAGTIIERLGRASAGKQDADGGKWSPESFLTNWNRMRPEARAELLSGIPNAAEVQGLVENVARATSMMRDNSRMWANPSGTAANATARTVLGTIGFGGAGAAMGLVNPLVPLGAAAGLAGVNLTARAVTSNRIREAMMRRTEIDPEAQNALIRAMASSGRL